MFRQWSILSYLSQSVFITFVAKSTQTVVGIVIAPNSYIGQSYAVESSSFDHCIMYHIVKNDGAAYFKDLVEAIIAHKIACQAG